MKITILCLVVFGCVIQIAEEAATDKPSSINKVSKKENPVDVLLHLANSLLRGDVIATLTKIVEVVQKQDTGLLLEIGLIILHRMLIILQPIFYILFPSTKDQGNTVNNFKSRLKTISHLMNMLMQ